MQWMWNLTLPYVIIRIIFVPIFYDDNESEWSGEMEKETEIDMPAQIRENHNKYKNIYEKILQTISEDVACSMREKKPRSKATSSSSTATSPIPIPFLHKKQNK